MIDRQRRCGARVTVTVTPARVTVTSVEPFGEGRPRKLWPVCSMHTPG